jgi:hypothetical protein
MRRGYGVRVDEDGSLAPVVLRLGRSGGHSLEECGTRLRLTLDAPACSLLSGEGGGGGLLAWPLPPPYVGLYTRPVVLLPSPRAPSLSSALEAVSARLEACWRRGGRLVEVSHAAALRAGWDSAPPCGLDWDEASELSEGRRGEGEGEGDEEGSEEGDEEGEGSLGEGEGEDEGEDEGEGEGALGDA